MKQENRYRGVTDDVLGVTPHKEPSNATPAVRAAHDQIRRPLRRLLDDLRARGLSDLLDQHRLSIGAGATGHFFRFVEMDSPAACNASTAGPVSAPAASGDTINQSFAT